MSNKDEKAIDDIPDQPVENGSVIKILNRDSNTGLTNNGDVSEGGWGWEAFGSEDEADQDQPQPQQIVVNIDADIPLEGSTHKEDVRASKDVSASIHHELASRKTANHVPSDEKNILSNLSTSGAYSSHRSIKTLSPGKRGGGGSNSSIHLIKGIASSPSFNELEMAIGATIAMSSHDSGDQLQYRGGGSGSPNMHGANLQHAYKLSSTDLTQQKVQQQRFRQQQQHQHQHRHSILYSHGLHHSNTMLHQQHLLQQKAMAAADHLNQTTISNATSCSQARTELTPFINESESRAMIIFHSSQATPLFVRDTCSKFGVLYYIRPEFHSKGFTLISYFDLRSATSAKARIAEELGGDSSAHFSVMLHAANSNSEEFRLVVKDIPEDRSESEIQTIFSRYGQLRSIEKSFSSASTGDDGDVASDSTSHSIEFFNIQDARLAASELSATSAQVWDEHTIVSFAPLDDRKQQLCRQLLATLSRWRTEMATSNNFQQQQQIAFGLFNQAAVGASIQQTGISSPIAAATNLAMGMGHPFPQLLPSAAATSAVPINSTQIIPGSPLSMGMSFPQNGMIHTQSGGGMNLLTPFGTVSGSPPTGSGNILYCGPFPSGMMQAQLPTNSLYGGFPDGFPNEGMAANGFVLQQQQQSNSSFHGNSQNAGFHAEHEHRGSSNQYNGQAYHRQRQQQFNGAHQTHTDTIEQQQHYDPQSMMHTVKSFQAQADGSNTHYSQNSNLNDRVPHHHNGGYNGQGALNQPNYRSHGESHNRRMKGGGSGGPGNAIASNSSSNVGVLRDNPVDSDFALDLRRIEQGTELRTTVMVRNIPNKYNQSMLLEEVNVNHEGTYDFFYLPIDFKNRCNVGYGFINFMDPRSIPFFVREFNGHRWKSFNSEKVCAVTFARIQGKQSMVARFQNSSLLEKDDEYQPLLFVSDGPERGKPEPFPLTNRQRSGTSNFVAPPHHHHQHQQHHQHNHHQQQGQQHAQLLSHSLPQYQTHFVAQKPDNSPPPSQPM